MQKGWFKIDDHYDGDRTLEEQLTGLDLICERASGKSVLDLGCAEGLIGLHLKDQCGARLLHGFSIVPSEIEKARQLSESKREVAFQVLDLSTLPSSLTRKPPLFLPRYDIILLLAILHKLQYPRLVLEQVLTLARGMIAVRLPGPIIDDERSKNIKFDVRAWLKERSLLVDEPKGPRGEWMGIFENFGSE